MMSNLTKPAVNKGTSVSQGTSKGDAKGTSNPRKGLFKSLFQSANKKSTADDAKTAPGKQKVAEGKDASTKVKSDDSQNAGQTKNDVGDKKTAKDNGGKTGQADPKGKKEVVKNGGGDSVPLNIGGTTSTKVDDANMKTGEAAGETGRSSKNSDSANVAETIKNETANSADKKGSDQAAKVAVKKGNHPEATSKTIDKSSQNAGSIQTDNKTKVVNGEAGEVTKKAVDTDVQAKNTDSVKSGAEESSTSKGVGSKASSQNVGSGDVAPQESNDSQTGSANAGATGDKLANDKAQSGSDAAQKSPEVGKKAGSSRNTQDKTGTGEQSEKVKLETTNDQTTKVKTGKTDSKDTQAAQQPRAAEKPAAGQNREAASNTIKEEAGSSSRVASNKETSSQDKNITQDEAKKVTNDKSSSDSSGTVSNDKGSGPINKDSGKVDQSPGKAGGDKLAASPSRQVASNNEVSGSNKSVNKAESGNGISRAPSSGQSGAVLNGKNSGTINTGSKNVDPASEKAGSEKQNVSHAASGTSSKAENSRPVESQKANEATLKGKPGSGNSQDVAPKQSQGENTQTDTSPASSSQNSGSVDEGGKQATEATSSQQKATGAGDSQTGPGTSPKQQRPITGGETAKKNGEPAQGKKAEGGTQQVEVPKGESNNSDNGRNHQTAPVGRGRGDIPNQKHQPSPGGKVYTKPAVEKPEVVSKKLADDAVKQARQENSDQTKEPASQQYVNGKAADTLVKEGGIQSIKAEQMRDKRYREHISSFAKRASLTTNNDEAKSSTRTVAQAGSGALGTKPPIDFQSNDSMLTAKLKIDDESQLWKEGSPDNLDIKKHNGTSQNHPGYARLGQVPVSNISVKRNVIPGLTKAVMKATSGGKTATENWQKHNFTLDDGKNINLSVRQSDGVIQLKLGSMHSDLNRLLQQYQHQIKEHLEQECGLKIDLQFENSDDNNMTDFFNQSSGSGQNHGNSGRMKGPATSPQKVEKVLLKSVRKFGYNRMEWTA